MQNCARFHHLESLTKAGSLHLEGSLGVWTQVCLFFKDFIYLKDSTSRGEGQREREKQTPC